MMSDGPITRSYMHHQTMQEINEHICAIEFQNRHQNDFEIVGVFGRLIFYDPLSNEVGVDLSQIADTADQLSIAPETLLRDLVWLADVLLPIEDALNFHRGCTLWLVEDDAARTRASIFKAYLSMERKDRAELAKQARGGGDAATVSREDSRNC